MKPILWSLIVLAVVAWSLLAWGSSELLEWAGGVTAAHADRVSSHPETVEWLSWAVGLLAGLGQGTILVVWLAGLLLTIALPVGLSALRWVRRGRGDKALSHGSGPASDARHRSARPLTDTFLRSRRLLPRRSRPGVG